MIEAFGKLERERSARFAVQLLVQALAADLDRAELGLAEVENLATSDQRRIRFERACGLAVELEHGRVENAAYREFSVLGALPELDRFFDHRAVALGRALDRHAARRRIQTERLEIRRFEPLTMRAHDRFEARIADLEIDVAFGGRAHHEAALLAVELELLFAARDAQALDFVLAQREQGSVDQLIDRHVEAAHHTLRYARRDRIGLATNRDQIVFAFGAGSADLDHRLGSLCVARYDRDFDPRSRREPGLGGAHVDEVLGLGSRKLGQDLVEVVAADAHVAEHAVEAPAILAR